MESHTCKVAAPPATPQDLKAWQHEARPYHLLLRDILHTGDLENGIHKCASKVASEYLGSKQNNPNLFKPDALLILEGANFWLELARR